MNYKTSIVVGQIMPLPEEVQVLMARSGNYAALHGKRNFVDMIKVRVLRDGDIVADYPSGPNGDTTETEFRN